MQMQMLYDTRSVHPLDRYDYYQAVSTTELAPVAVNGRAPGCLLAVAVDRRCSWRWARWSGCWPASCWATGSLARSRV
jgi:hypothetical protein